MKRAFAVLTLLAGLTCAGCSSLVRATADFDFKVPWQNYECVEVQVRNGGVDLALGEGDAVLISGTKQAGGATLAEAERNLEEVEIAAEPHGHKPGTLLVEVRYPASLNNRNVGANLKIRVPKACAADVQTSNGAVAIADMTGPLEAETSNGSVTIRHAAGSVRVQSSNGRIDVDGVEGDLSATTSNGSLKAAGVRGNCDATSSNGDVVVAVTPSAGGHVIAETSNGSVRLTIPHDLAADVELATTNGGVHVQLGECPMKITETGKKRFAAKINGGGVKVRGVTSNGSVTISNP